MRAGLQKTKYKLYLKKARIKIYFKKNKKK